MDVFAQALDRIPVDAPFVDVALADPCKAEKLNNNQKQEFYIR